MSFLKTYRTLVPIFFLLFRNKSGLPFSTVDTLGPPFAFSTAALESSNETNSASTILTIVKSSKMNLKRNSCLVNGFKVIPSYWALVLSSMHTRSFGWTTIAADGVIWWARGAHLSSISTLFFGSARILMKISGFQSVLIFDMFRNINRIQEIDETRSILPLLQSLKNELQFQYVQNFIRNSLKFYFRLDKYKDL